jgi:hypothetical protein
MTTTATSFSLRQGEVMPEQALAQVGMAVQVEGLALTQTPLRKAGMAEKGQGAEKLPALAALAAAALPERAPTGCLRKERTAYLERVPGSVDLAGTAAATTLVLAGVATIAEAAAAPLDTLAAALVAGTADSLMVM